jgi:hypothetical protein
MSLSLGHVVVKSHAPPLANFFAPNPLQQHILKPKVKMGKAAGKRALLETGVKGEAKHFRESI